MKEIR